LEVLTISKPGHLAAGFDPKGTASV
jgi:hypothetical protein